MLSKIGFCIPWITRGTGGTENVGQMMANAMAQRGYSVTIFTHDDRLADSKFPLDDNIKLIHLNEQQDYISEYNNLISIIETNIDLLVGLHMNRGFLRYAYYANKLKIPLVVSEHIDPHFPQQMGTFTQDERISAFTDSEIIHLLVPEFIDTLPNSLKDKIRIIPNTTYSKINASTIARSNKIITVARMVPRKNLEHLLKEFSQALPRLKNNWVLQVIGDGPDKAKLIKLATKLKITDNVEFVGHSNNPQGYLLQGKVFILPSVFEGFPMSSLEAMACGLPLIGYEYCNGINRQIVDGENGYLADIKIQGKNLSNLMVKLLNNEEDLISFGENSYKLFHENYSESIVIPQWEKIFQEAYSSYHFRMGDL